MKPEARRKWYKVSTIAGATLILLPNGVSMYWGNMSVYVTSYVVVCLETTKGVEAPWTFSLFVGFWTLGLLLSTTVGDLIGQKRAAALGFVLSDLGIAGSYLAVQYSFALLNLTLAVATGIGTGLLQAHCLRLVVSWANNDTGFIMSITQGSFFWGSIVVGQLTTFYLNPYNAVPDTRIDNSVYFTQTEILDKVPSVFLVLACFAVGCHVIGYSLLRENTFEKSKEQGSYEEIENGADTCEEDGGYNSNNNGIEEAKGWDRLGAHNSTTSFISAHTEVENETSRLVLEEGDQQEQHAAINNSDDAVDDNEPNTKEDSTPRQALLSSSFYVLWVIFLFAEYPYILLGNYYKSFGQVYIQDDFFLTGMGSTMALANILVRILWGVAVDRIGVKNVLILGVLSVIMVALWIYFTAIVDKWFYFFITNAFSALAGSFFGSVPVVAVAVFGRKHFSTNYGLLRSSSFLLTFLCPLVTGTILKYCGWFYVFASSSFMNVVSLILILFCLPQLK